MTVTGERSEVRLRGLVVTFEGNRFTGAFCDLDGTLDYEQTFER